MAAIEAASCARLAALCFDLDAEACAAAAANSAAAAPPAAPGRVSAVQCDGLRLPLRPGLVDGVVADLPFGMRHARLDVAALLRELARVLRPGGRAVHSARTFKMFGDRTLISGAFVHVVVASAGTFISTNFASRLGEVS